MKSTHSYTDNWIVIGGSVAGQKHLQQNILCQDAHNYTELNGWGIAIVCDGAGSATYADIGATETTRIATIEIQNLVQQNKWIENATFPSQKEWNTIANQVAYGIYTKLQLFAIKNKYTLSDLACTIIVLINSPLGVLLFHIGDGRGAYCDTNKNWHTLFTPFRGEYANETVFITSAIWQDTDKYIGTNYIPNPITAFALLSDGVEKYCFHLNEKLGTIFVSKNEPYTLFLDPLIENIRALNSENTPTEMQELWLSFLQNGTIGLEQEEDDKTLIIGVSYLS